jgi:hypothetical protein
MENIMTIKRKKTKKNAGENMSTHNKTDWDSIDTFLNISTKAEKGISLIKVNTNVNFIVIFTIFFVRVMLHYLKYQEIFGYYHCNGEGCTLCQIGNKVVEKLLFPVYPVELEEICLLPVSPSLAPAALLPQLLSIFASQKSKKHLISIRKEEWGKFSVGLLDLDTGLKKRITPVIKEFRTRKKAGLLDVESVYKRIDNDSLAQIPEIARILELPGVNQKTYDLYDNED